MHSEGGSEIYRGSTDDASMNNNNNNDADRSIASGELANSRSRHKMNDEILTVGLQNCRYEIDAYIELLCSEVDAEFSLSSSSSSSSMMNKTTEDIEKENVELFHAILALDSHRTSLLNPSSSFGDKKKRHEGSSAIDDDNVHGEGHIAALEEGKEGRVWKMVSQFATGNNDSDEMMDEFLEEYLFGDEDVGESEDSSFDENDDDYDDGERSITMIKVDASSQTDPVHEMPLVSLPAMLEESFLASASLLGKHTRGGPSMLQWVMMGDQTTFTHTIQMSTRLRTYVRENILRTAPFCHIHFSGGGEEEENREYIERCKSQTYPPPSNSSVRTFYETTCSEREEVFGGGSFLAEMVHFSSPQGSGEGSEGGGDGECFITTVPVGFGEKKFMYGMWGARKYSYTPPPPSKHKTHLNAFFIEQFIIPGVPESSTSYNAVIWDLRWMADGIDPYWLSYMDCEPGHTRMAPLSFLPDRNGVTPSQTIVTNCPPGFAFTDKETKGENKWFAEVLGIPTESYPFRTLMTDRYNDFLGLLSRLRYRSLCIFGRQFIMRDEESFMRMLNISFFLFGSHLKNNPFSHFFHPQVYKQHKERQLLSPSPFHPPMHHAFGFGQPSTAYSYTENNSSSSWMLGIQLSNSEMDFCRNHHVHPRVYLQLRRSLVEDPFRRSFCELEIGYVISRTMRGIRRCSGDDNLIPDLVTASELVSFFESEGWCCKLNFVEICI